MRGWADFCFLFPTDDAYEKKADHFRKQPSNNPSAFSSLLACPGTEQLQEYKFAVWKKQCRNRFFWFISIERLG